MPKIDQRSTSKSPCAVRTRTHTHRSRHGLLRWHGGDCVCTSVCDCEGMQHSDTLPPCSAGLLLSCTTHTHKLTQIPVGHNSNTFGQINAGNTELRLQRVCFKAFNALLYVPNMAASSQRDSAERRLRVGGMYVSGIRRGQRVEEARWAHTSPRSPATTTNNSRWE